MTSVVSADRGKSWLSVVKEGPSNVPKPDATERVSKLLSNRNLANRPSFLLGRQFNNFLFKID